MKSTVRYLPNKYLQKLIEEWKKKTDE